MEDDTKGFRTKKNKKIALSMIYRMLKEPFYYGKFEYPVDSGKFYKGKTVEKIKKEIQRFQKFNYYYDRQ